MKKIIIGLFVLIGILIIVTLVAYFNLNTIIEQGIRKFGPQVVKTSVGLEKANVSLFSGEGKLYNLSVGNPKGFTSPYLFKVKKIDIKVEPMSVFKDVVVIDKIYIDSPYIVYEYKQKTSNLDVFQKNISTTKVPEKKETAVKKTESQKGQKHIFIKDLIIKNSQVEVILSDLGLKKKQVLLKEIHLRNLGGKNKSQKQIIAEITNSLMSQILPSIAPTIKDLKGSIKEIKGQVQQKVKQSLQDLKKGSLDKNKINSQVKEIQKGLKGLMPKR